MGEAVVGRSSLVVGNSIMKKDFRTKNLLSQFALNPQFIEIHDCVFLRDTAAESLPKEGPTSEEDRQSLERLLNRRDISELFEVPPPDPSPRLLCEAGNMLRELWENRLKQAFPDRKFVVYFQYALPICEITFFQGFDWQPEAQAQAKSARNSRADWRPRFKPVR